MRLWLGWWWNVENQKFLLSILSVSLSFSFCISLFHTHTHTHTYTHKALTDTQIQRFGAVTFFYKMTLHQESEVGNRSFALIISQRDGCRILITWNFRRVIPCVVYFEACRWCVLCFPPNIVVLENSSSSARALNIYRFLSADIATVILRPGTEQKKRWGGSLEAIKRLAV